MADMHRKNLRACELVKIYKKGRIVDQVSMTINPGEIVGILGPNGAGKTTCFYMMTGLVRADQGRVFLNGQDITILPLHKRARLGIGYLPQESSIFRRMSVYQNMMAIAELVYNDKKQQKYHVEQLLQEFAIEHLTDSQAYLLSGGERRRLEIARSLLTQPTFLLLDEPFAGVDPVAVKDIRNLLRHLRDRGLGILLTDHNVWAIMEWLDRAYILHEGKILFEGTPEAIMANQQVREIYLGHDFFLSST